MNTPTLNHIKLLILAFILSVGISTLSAWTNPPGAPTTCPTGTPGCDAPVHIGPAGQIKTGGLSLGSGLDDTGVGLAVLGGKVGVGVEDPTEKVDVLGFVKGRSGLCIGNDCRSEWPAGGSGGGGTGSLQYVKTNIFVASQPNGSYNLSNLVPADTVFIELLGSCNSIAGIAGEIKFEGLDFCKAGVSYGAGLSTYAPAVGSILVPKGTFNITSINPSNTPSVVTIAGYLKGGAGGGTPTTPTLSCVEASRLPLGSVSVISGSPSSAVEAYGIVGSGEGTLWGMRCVNGYSKMDCSIGGGLGFNGGDLRYGFPSGSVLQPEGANYCLSDNDEITANATMYITCCKIQ